MYFELGDLEWSISSATLSLTPTTNNTTLNEAPWTVLIYALTNESLDNWSESTITWNNSPGHDPDSAGFNNDAILLGELSIPQGVTGTTYTFSSQELVDFLNSDTDGRVTFMLSRTSSPAAGFNLGFASSEHENASFRPTLTYEVVPEPARMAFLAMGGLFLMMSRRRRI